MIKKILPTQCPSCSSTLSVLRLGCPSCGTAVEGEYKLPPLARLDREDQEFILNLVLSGGSLKELSALYGISYPTVRNRLDALIERLRSFKEGKDENAEGVK